MDSNLASDWLTLFKNGQIDLRKIKKVNLISLHAFSTRFDSKYVLCKEFNRTSFDNPCIEEYEGRYGFYLSEDEDSITVVDYFEGIYVSNSIDNYKIQSGFMHHFLLVVDNKRILLVQQIRQKFFLHLIRYSLRTTKFNVTAISEFEGRCMGLYLDESDSNQLIMTNKQGVILGTINEDRISTKLESKISLNDIECVKLVKGKVYGISKREKGPENLNAYKVFTYDFNTCLTSFEYFEINLTDNFTIGYYDLFCYYVWFGDTLYMAFNRKDGMFFIYCFCYTTLNWSNTHIFGIGWVDGIAISNNRLITLSVYGQIKDEPKNGIYRERIYRLSLDQPPTLKWIVEDRIHRSFSELLNKIPPNLQSPKSLLAELNHCHLFLQ